MTVLAESERRSGSLTIYGSSGNSVDGFRSSERNSFGEIGPARRTADGRLHDFPMVKRSTYEATIVEFGGKSLDFYHKNDPIDIVS